jgi:YD repeat-containing protein
VAVLPFSNPATIRAAQQEVPAGEATTSLRNEAPDGHGPTALRDAKSLPGKPDGADQELARKAGFAGVPNFAESVMGFANAKTVNQLNKLLANKTAAAGEAEQDPTRPTITPPTPELGSGGTGPEGSFSVDSPERVQGPPAAVRSTSEVLNEARTPPRIPEPIPSTESYCWPRDPACRKPPAAKPRTPAPKPTPPPRQQGASVMRPELVVASNEGYVEKLMSSALPHLAHLWNVDDLHQFLTANRDHTSRASALLAFRPATSVRPMSVSASSIWADCTNVEGNADNAQLTVYIYVDGLQVGTTQVDGSSYFIFDISAYVNDGGNHDVSAWYYDTSWNWLEAGSTSVSGCNPVYDFDTPRLEPLNNTGDPGVNPGSQNINWSVPLVGLPGRGLDLNLLLTYNSLVWTKSADGAAIMFDPDHGFPSPGFRLRFPIMQPLFFNPGVGVSSYMLVTSTGARIELRQVSSNTYESADSSYIKMVHHGVSGATVWLKDGTQMSFSPSVNDEMRCTKIKDRNGNFISVSYTAQGNINTVTDTLGRQIVFHLRH